MSIDAYGQTSGSNCDSSETIEATLTVDGTAHDGSFENAGGLHYFQIEPATDIDVIIETTFTNNNLEYSLQLCDSNDNLIASDSNDNQNIWVPLISGTYYIVVGSSGADQYQLRVITDTRDKTSLSDCEDLITSFPDDPLYGCQWYLKNTGQWRFNGQRITAGEDINVEEVWNDEIFGSGINVVVVDTGLDSDHEDLAANVNLNLNHDYSGNNNVFNPSNAHGTYVAGVIAAAGDNELGVRGVAPQASIYSYNLVRGSNFNSANRADAMTRNHIITAVSNNSWGSGDTPVLHPAESTWEMAVETGVREGFGGKGVFYSWGAGNGVFQLDRSNFEEHTNYYAVTSVCSVDGFGRRSSFSEEGVNLWICAPGSNITTTDNEDLYNSGVSGTSYAAPIVSGIAALMREVNSDLSWRDLKLILAASARKNDPTDPGWETVALKYGSDSENYNYNPKYGFGVVDAAAAVELAENWNRVPQMRTLTASANDIDIAIPDYTGGVDGEIISRLTIPDTDDLFTEFVEINITFTHAFFPELEIQITSPDGTVSQLSEEYIQVKTIPIFYQLSMSYTDYTHRFGSAKHLGEDPAGEWTLKISDTRSNKTGTLHSWSIKVYGHRSDDTVPTFGNEMIIDKEYMTETAVTEMLPSAARGNGTLTYSLTPALPAGLSFNPDTQELSGTPTTVTSKTIYTYTVTDDEGDTDELTFGITVEADTEPDFGSETVPDQRYVAGTTANLPVTLPSATGGNEELRYSITPPLPNGLNFNENTQELSGAPASASSGTYTYTVTDGDGDTDELTFRITVETDTEPDFGSDTIDDQLYVAGTTTNLPVTLPEATGGNEELTYSITPALPNGLNFNENTQEISGTPTAAKNKTTYTYTVTDGDGDTDELTFGVTVEADSEPDFGSEMIDDQLYVAGTTTNLPVILPSATGGNGTLTYSLTPALPSGLNFNNNTQEISGTPTAAKSKTTYTYTVTDGDGDTDELTFGVTVETDTEPDFGSETIDDQLYVAGTTTNLPVTLPEATGGNEELTYSITPALPNGLSFDASTREINGTPASVSSGTYTYKVVDADGDTDQTTFGITVVANEAPDFGSETIDDQVYIAGTQTRLPVTLPSATGGNGELTYSITPALPNGLNFNENTQKISGTPTAAKSKTTYTYTVTDGDGDTDELTFGVTVEADTEPDFGSETIDDQLYVAGTTTHLPVTLPEAAGGNEELTYSITPALPNGLNFNENTRRITGTPARASSATYTYTVTDTDGDTTEVSFMLRVTDPPDRRPPPRPTPPPDTESGGGGGCAISDQNNVVSDLFGVMACLMLIPISVVIRRLQIKT